MTTVTPVSPALLTTTSNTGVVQPSPSPSEPTIPQDVVEISQEAMERLQEQHRAAEIAVSSALEFQRRILNVSA